MGLGLGLGLDKLKGLTPIQRQANAFKARVIADGGVFEAKLCLVNQLKILNNIA